MSTITKINRRKNKEAILKWAEQEGIDLNSVTFDELMDDFDQRFRGYYKDLKTVSSQEND